LLNCIKRGLAVTAVAGLGVLAAAPGALASSTVNAYGIKVSLLNTAALGPLPLSNLSNPTNSLPSITIPFIGSAGALTSHVAQDTAAGTESATASTASISLGTLPGGGSIASAGAISATCTATSSGVTGSSNFATLSAVGVTIPLNPGPNTALTIPLLGSLVLNEQITNPDGSLTVNAFHLKVLPVFAGGGDLILGSATCGPAPAAGTPLAEGPGLYIGLALLGTIGFSVVYARNRRRGTDLPTATQS
jgi:hypothetical protein